MSNALAYITKQGYEKLKFDKNTKVVIIDGSKIQTWEDYWNEISEKFEFPELPDGWESDFYSYYDFMGELDWIKEDSIVLIIENFNSFFSTDLKAKNDEIETFVNYILPFWDEEVERVVVGGKRRDFNVYCVT